MTSDKEEFQNVLQKKVDVILKQYLKLGCLGEFVRRITVIMMNVTFLLTGIGLLKAELSKCETLYEAEEYKRALDILILFKEDLIEKFIECPPFYH